MARRAGPPLTIAFLGCGDAARMHTRTLVSCGGPLRRIYASRDAARAARFDRELGGDGACGAYEEALARDDVAVALITLPPALHLEWTLRALRAGKHVIVEKPAFLSPCELDSAAAAAREVGRRLLVAENYFYKPLTTALRGLVAAGAVGEVLLIHLNALKRQAAAGWRDDAALAGGGALFEGGVHWIHLLGNIGLTVAGASALRAGAGAGPDRTVAVSLRYREGAIATLHYSWDLGGLINGARLSRIYGRRGSILFETNGAFLLLRGRATRLLLPGLRDLAGYRAMFTDFLDALRTGRETRLTLPIARRDLEILDELRLSLSHHDGK